MSSKLLKSSLKKWDWGGQNFACDNCNVQELSKEVEEALVKCLEMCADFNYPMMRRDLQVDTVPTVPYHCDK